MGGTADGRTWYQVMGLPVHASDHEIRAAYLRLARNLHPDRYAAGTPTERQLAERRMREVNAAWSVLGDPEARRQYDAELWAAKAERVSRAQGTTPGTAGRGNFGRPAASASGRPAGWSSTPGAPGSNRARREVWGDEEIDARYDEDDVVELTAAQHFLLRRVPVILAVLVALAIFVGSAFAGRREEVPVEPKVASSTTIAGDPCVGDGC